MYEKLSLLFSLRKSKIFSLLILLIFFESLTLNGISSICDFWDLKAHIITDRTRSTYKEFVDMEELDSEDDTVAGPVSYTHLRAHET